MEYIEQLPFLLARIAISAFLAILFLQSGLDKVIDWKGNTAWLKDHFSKTAFRNSVPAMTATLTVVELAAGVLSAIDTVLLVLTGFGYSFQFIWSGLIASVLALLMLFSGQRIAKDYAGASTLTIYFIVVIIGIVLAA